MTESVLLIILLIALAEVINSIKKIARQPQISDDYFIFVLKPWD